MSGAVRSGLIAGRDHPSRAAPWGLRVLRGACSAYSAAVSSAGSPNSLVNSAKALSSAFSPVPFE
jgi:hypothetical protein